MRRKLIQSLMFLSLFSYCSSGFAEENASSSPEGESSWAKSAEGQNIQFDSGQADKSSTDALAAVKKISNNIQVLKKEVVELNKDLRIMEEKLLFPSNTKYTVFVSSSAGQFFTLESIKLKIDGKLVATHIYSDKQRLALVRGGVQQLYTTNLNEGSHSATVFFTGIGPLGRPYKRAQSLNFEKGPGGEYLQLAVSDDGATQEPVFQLKQW